jgi:hypothetical protein
MGTTRSLLKHPRESVAEVVLEAEEGWGVLGLSWLLGVRPIGFRRIGGLNSSRGEIAAHTITFDPERESPNLEVNTRMLTMAKWCALLFAAIGYVLVIWYYSVAFSPLTWNFGRDLLWHMCLSCTSISGLHSSTLRAAFLILAPINALIYAVAGFLLGKLIVKLGRNSHTHP